MLAAPSQSYYGLPKKGRWAVIGTCVKCCLGFVLVLLRPAATAQGDASIKPDANPSFEVAAITLSDPNNGSSGFQVRGRRVIVLNETVESMLVFAYGLQKSQLSGAPPWVATDHYDINAVPDQPGMPSTDQIRSMLRKLLAERYGLRSHEERRELLVYVLRVAKGGPKLARTASAPGSNPDQTGNSGRVSDWRFTNEPLSDFAHFLQFIMDRPVVDQTGVSGEYDFRLKWASDARLEGDPDGGPGIFTAMPEQLGLRLDPVKAPARIMVIDHVERPSAN